MLWYKSWLETRWRFVIGFVLLTCSAAVAVFGYPVLAKGLPRAASVNADGVLGQQIREVVKLAREYRGYVWWQWFHQTLRETWTIFAVLLGTGGLLSQSSGGAALFTLSMPVSRRRLLGVRAATALAELFVLALVPALMVPLLSPAVGQTYSVADALVHGFCLFVAGTAFFSLAFLLSTVFHDVWRPALIDIALAYLWFFAEQISEQMYPEVARFGFFRVMTAQQYFRAGELPWFGLLAIATASAGMLYSSTLNIARRDF